MARTAAKRRAKTPTRRFSRRLWRPRFLGALLIGLLLIALAGLLWQQFAGDTFSDRLIRKLPRDSQTAGVAKLSNLDSAAVKQYAQGGNVYAANVQAIIDALGHSGLTKDQIDGALEDQFAWARTPRGSLAVFTIANESELRTVAEKLGTQLDGRQAGDSDGIKVETGTLHGTQIPVATGVSGRELYLASNADLIKAAVKEQDGFTGLPDFAKVSEALPPASGGYVFFNTPVSKATLGFDASLVGVAWSPKRDGLDLTMKTSDTSSVQNGLAGTSGDLLPTTDLATASVEGKQVSRYLALLEEQRQESDLPRVLSLQNGLANLSRTVGANVTNRYIDTATGRFMYGRYADPTGGAQWIGLLEFPSAEAANVTAGDLISQLSQKVTVPVRHEVVTVLPDGTQSREVVSEGRVPLAFVDFTVGDKVGKAAALPNLGTVHVLVSDKYVLMASTPDGIQRLLTSLSQKHADVHGGALAIRAKVADAYQLLGGRDVIYDWILATRPSGGHFTLTTAGELTGSLEFNERQ